MSKAVVSENVNLASLEKVVTGEEVFSIIEAIVNPRVIDISGGTIYSGKHPTYGNIRLFATTSDQAFLIYSDSDPARSFV